MKWMEHVIVSWSWRCSAYYTGGDNFDIPCVTLIHIFYSKYSNIADFNDTSAIFDATKRKYILKSDYFIKNYIFQ